MKTRFHKNAKVADILITAIGGTLSVGMTLYGIFHFGLSETWPELVLNIFYIICFALIWMYFFNIRVNTHQFNYWCSLSMGITVLLRDVLCPPTLTNYAMRSVSFTLAVLLLCTLTYFYARREWKAYTKNNLWIIFVVDALIAAIYQVDIMYFEQVDEYTNYYLTEIWIRPTISYGLVSCFVTELTENEEKMKDEKIQTK